jgi:ribosome-associated protein
LWRAAPLCAKGPGLIHKEGKHLSPHTTGKTPASPASPVGLSADAMAEVLIASLDDDKAEDIVAIDIRGKSSVADLLIVASGRSQRHVGALADHLARKLSEIGVKNVRVEGLSLCDWVLVDAGDVIVHLFRPEVRTFYNIEHIWQGEPRRAAHA